MRKRRALGIRTKEDPEKKKIANIKWRLEHPNYHKEYKKKGIKINPVYKQKMSREYWEGYRKTDKYKESQKIQYDIKQRNGAWIAKKYVYKAILRGELISLSKNIIKCTLCDNRATQYDHRDYNKRLDVTPVCQSCNMRLGPAIPLIR